MSQNTPFNQGPYLLAALLCEKLLIEQDGVVSAIRIVDRVFHTATGPNPPEKLEPFDYEVTLFLNLKAGFAHGSYKLRVDIINPRGETSALFEKTVFFEGPEERGVNEIARLRVHFADEGIYWFEISGEDKFLTRIPFRIIYQRIITRPGGERGSQPPIPGSPSGVPPQ